MRAPSRLVVGGWLCLGLALIFGGFVYDVLFAGIPYQDATPEQATRYANNAWTASMIRWLGLLTVVAGVFAGCVRLVSKRRDRPGEIDSQRTLR